MSRNRKLPHQLEGRVGRRRRRAFMRPIAYMFDKRKIREITRLIQETMQSTSNEYISQRSPKVVILDDQEFCRAAASEGCSYSESLQLLISYWNTEIVSQEAANRKILRYEPVCEQCNGPYSALFANRTVLGIERLAEHETDNNLYHQTVTLPCRTIVDMMRRWKHPEAIAARWCGSTYSKFAARMTAKHQWGRFNKHQENANNVSCVFTRAVFYRLSTPRLESCTHYYNGRNVSVLIALLLDRMNEWIRIRQKRRGQR